MEMLAGGVGGVGGVNGLAGYVGGHYAFGGGSVGGCLGPSRECNQDKGDR